ncbi:hypothetical protein KM043_006020 [Ampulex compressa]|nr:hypothetical protein KM043_006020 [Ampulex compressa]
MRERVYQRTTPVSSSSCAIYFSGRHQRFAPSKRSSLNHCPSRTARWHTVLLEELTFFFVHVFRDTVENILSFPPPINTSRACRCRAHEMSPVSWQAWLPVVRTQLWQIDIERLTGTKRRIIMGKRYYCDYCDRSFKDDAEARKKHLSSLQHVKNRADHYNMFKDPEVILREECAKTPCKRYMTSGDCAFGLGCRFSHYTPPMIWELQRIVAMRNASKASVAPEKGWPNPENIIEEYFEDTGDSSTTEEFQYPVWSIPLELHSYPNLPPSLWPITPESVTDSNFAKWGITWYDAIFTTHQPQAYFRTRPAGFEIDRFSTNLLVVASPNSIVKAQFIPRLSTKWWNCSGVMNQTLNIHLHRPNSSLIVRTKGTSESTLNPDSKVERPWESVVIESGVVKQKTRGHSFIRTRHLPTMPRITMAVVRRGSVLVGNFRPWHLPLAPAFRSPPRLGVSPHLASAKFKSGEESPVAFRCRYRDYDIEPSPRFARDSERVPIADPRRECLNSGASSVQRDAGTRYCDWIFDRGSHRSRRDFHSGWAVVDVPPNVFGIFYKRQRDRR